MINTTLGKKMVNAIVSISRFNKGEAGKIFDEVEKDGAKIVVKNNKPACVLVSPSQYEEMMEVIEDYYLLLEAEKRMKDSQDIEYMTQEEMLEELNIDPEELKVAEVEID